MRTIFTLLFTVLITLNISAQWKPAGDKLKTKWASEIDVNNVLPEYPRPIMERTEWQNLNGLWNYAILPVGQQPSSYDGEILVPFAVESSLSGVQKRVGEDKELWYQREFTVPSKWRNNKILLHFGAVDWRADVWVNDVKVGRHQGGYTPFSFDITAALVNGTNTIKVKVWDPTDRGFQPRGKQVNRPEGIWYTPVTGIWQTVWLEPVPETYIKDLKVTPNIDNNTLLVDAITNIYTSANRVEVTVKDGNSIVAKGKSINKQPVEIAMPQNVKLWTPDNPHLYDLEVVVYDGNKQLDKVNSYAAMRKYSTKRDDKGIVRLQLNNKDLFQFGPLDQGWWPDGLYTAPTDEALEYDIIKTKDLGFNMIRKHVKVEPARWYTHCDRHGIIVWQDMPNGDRSPEWQMHNYFTGNERVRSAESEANYRQEWKEIIDYLYSYPSVGVWVPFNEAWGQFKTKEITEWTKSYDPTRLVNPASGGNHYTTGDILDLHNYPNPRMYLYDAQRATVLGEYGGIGWANKEHLWEPDRNWGYVQFNSSKEVTDEYVKYAEELKQLIRQGFSAAVYTQTTDVEVEVNGLLTYDRKLVKVDEARVRKVNQEICNILND
ncbi:MAG TPA: beta-galactosidase [Fermentimonas caenicola]|jgi:beta-galactosidase/beta-glucuronidase|uniref:Beta-galactosidase n=1 Tax=Fermentimonas caenicola TaxID=1562970 RepID=A0A098BZS4_9BACT|nr:MULTISPECIES: sugar-binding domain-containing protein [Lascolabacillus]MBP6174923.1 beta galactosidase jelly roll domain-containing protein [Fermentimonas sp.]MDI9626920.1 glycoside hydrolase family 2 TIM barrel-domain containing protein [Bacteroidota bacterium]TAH61792.1 MAG: beta-galactosidase [Fermentimonas caenicola]MBP6196097.1 beta galactosidase jelly roll domain-containing protein [Fermentimonas sp.]MBP7104854.1 beta galactosidase jelly roll domain-containing protein [Fermentimonas s